ncbi:MAG: hypothetical protein ABSB50_08405 [Terracidiphilus sp.]|jgi:hypothetical protein
MHIALSFKRCVFPLAFAIALPLLFSGAIGAQSGKIEIDYTGSLLGYYRMEYGEADQNHLPPVKSFLDYRKSDLSRLLLGMGDNFGPEFGASLQLENASTPDPPVGCHLIPNKTDTGETRPESLYKNDDRVAPLADCDNVLNFLMHAGFRAVVPGSQDFMYTARWLRVSQRLLSQADQDQAQSALIANYDHKINLLGANLRVTMKGKGGGSGGGGARCPLLFSQDPFSASALRCVGDGLTPEPLDWLDRLDRLSRNTGNNPTVNALRELASESAMQAQGRQVVLTTLVHDEISIMQSAWGLRFPVPALSPPAKSGQPQDAGEQVTKDQADAYAAALDRMSQCPAPSPTGDQAEMCAYKNRLSDILKSLSKILASPPSNQPRNAPQQSPASLTEIGASVTLTNDTRDDAIRGLLLTIASEEKDVGYTVAHSQDGSKALIVGVIGQDTLNAVSHTNLQMCPGDQKESIAAFKPCGDRASNFGGPTVVATDPVEIVEAIVRGAQLLEGCTSGKPCFDKIVVMAQMPHTEAEVLSERVWKLLTLDSMSQEVDAVVSEAEVGYGTPQTTIGFPASAYSTHPAPVVTPDPSYSSEDGSYPGKVSRVALVSAADHSFALTNQTDGIFTPPTVKGSLTTISLLSRLIAQLQPAPSAQSIIGTDSTSKQRAEFALLNDLQRSSRPHADVVLLQSRDVELDAIGPAYAGYEVCTDETKNADLCKLRAALDRIFWKGDFLEYVAVTGKSLKSILAASEAKMAEQAQLADTGFTQEWLISYGIVQSDLTNITQVNQNNEPLWIPVDPSCKGSTPGLSTYCVGGTPISDDAYYWLLTSDQLAEDKAVYGTLQSLPSANHQRTDVYVTAPLSHFFLNSISSPDVQVADLGGTSGSPQKLVTSGNEVFQQMPLWQVDFAKLIASFGSRAPINGNTFVQNNFAAVSDSRATAPTSQELDLELASRVTGTFFSPTGSARAFTSVSFGEQSAFAYDHAVIGNLTGKPINGSYSLNNLSEGAFVQVRLHAKGDTNVHSVRSTPRSLLVFTPHQYQIQINKPYLFFPYSGGELTIRNLPRVSGWNDRAGFRREFNQSSSKLRFLTFLGGNYFETGMEFSSQNGVLSSLTLKTGSNQKTCPVLANVSLQNCFSGPYGNPPTPLTINGTTQVIGSPGVRTLHSPGYYWDFHFQNHLFGSAPGKQVNLVTDSTGDYYFGRPSSAELPTQTKYAIPLSVALVLPVFGNLSFAPTYSGFFYKPQLSDSSLEVNSFSIAARWYFARDARVPLRRQIPLSGPASADQTHTGKGH